METDRKRGRRKLPDDERRDTMIRFRVNEKELAYLKQLVDESGLETGYYIRQQILKSKPEKNQKIPAINLEVYRTLGNLSNNINQIAKAINSGSFDQVNAAGTNLLIKGVRKRILGMLEDEK